MTMPWFVRRVLGIVPTLFLTWSIVFGVLQLIPGDPVMLAMGGTLVIGLVVGAMAQRMLDENLRDAEKKLKNSAADPGAVDR